MNILYYHKDNGLIMTTWQSYHFLDELKRMGHVITICNPVKYSSICEANEQLLLMLKNYKYDLFITPHGSDLIYPNTVLEIINKGIPSLLICFDNLHAPYMHKDIAHLFTLVWLTSFETKNIFEKWGCNCIFQPYAANPYLFSPKFEQEILSVGFIGTPYGTRINKINELVRNNINTVVYTNTKSISSLKYKKKKTISDYCNLIKQDYNLIKFSIGRKVLMAKLLKKISDNSITLDFKSPCLEIRDSVSFTEMNALYSNFALSLGITELWDTYLLKEPVHKLHLRTFEIPMCGGIQFTSYVEELSSYFENNKEIILYNSLEEYLDKAKYYLDNRRDKIRERIRIAARKRAENEHTWEHRFNCVFRELGLK